ncbi:unnamed protein product [Pseudo-nitzschia multistriata]|uniref:Uncharacterized protein n=1 Tax=Pseudo-nitzschia multistriata TaxID=183589 RepID=A0A448YUR0_9STRA|nr:unnamed protein product [Pseudo-nitzschia multistriata]
MALYLDFGEDLNPWATSSLIIVFVIRYAIASTPLSTEDLAPELVGIFARASVLLLLFSLSFDAAFVSSQSSSMKQAASNKPITSKSSV